MAGEERWECVGHNPTRWALGVVESGQITCPRATLMHQKNGRWTWQTHDWSASGPHHRSCVSMGHEPNRACAMAAVEFLLDEH